MSNYTVVGCDSNTIQKALLIRHSVEGIIQLRKDYMNELDRLRSKYQDEFDGHINKLRQLLDMDI